MPVFHLPEYIEIVTESTPNPKSLKFLFNFMILPNEILECTSIDDCSFSPLSKELLAKGEITNVFISNNYLTLTKSDTIDKEWFELTIELKEYFKKYFKDGGIVISEDYVASSKEMGAEDLSEIENKITILLDKYVKPAVEKDGGNIAFQSFDSGIVKVLLQGACSGCPSSTMTLKNGIEALLKKMIPEVSEVVAING